MTATTAATPMRPGSVDDAEQTLVESLQARDEATFDHLVRRYHQSLVRLAGTIVRDRAVAEEVAQDTWMAVLNGIDRFERRSSFQTWLYRILVNIARTRARKEARTLPFSAVSRADPDETETPDVALYDQAQGEAWRSGSDAPADDPERSTMGRELAAHLYRAIDALPERQRAVVQLRDVEGFDALAVCDLLDLSAANQRVLLHRGRMKIREALDGYLFTGTGAARPVARSITRTAGTRAASTRPMASQPATM